MQFSKMTNNVKLIACCHRICHVSERDKILDNLGSEIKTIETSNMRILDVALICNNKRL